MFQELVETLQSVKRGAAKRSILKTVQIIFNLGHYQNQFFEHYNFDRGILLIANILPEVNQVVHRRQ